MRTSTVLATLALTLSASAKTDIAGCVSTAVGASLLWYVPDTCEQCKILDCGGGRAPPKTDVPGCAAYKGTASYEPTYLTICKAAPTSVPAPTTSAEAYPTSVASSSPAGYAASSAPVPSKSSEPAGYPVASSSHVSTLATITSKPVSSVYYTATVIASLTHSVKTNVTASSTVRVPVNGTISTGGPKLPESTGGAALLSVGQGLMAVAMGALGVAML